MGKKVDSNISVQEKIKIIFDFHSDVKYQSR